MSAREQIAAAATLDGITDVQPYYRQSLRPGAGFVRMGARRRDDSGFGYMQEWEVWIATPATEVAAEKWLDAHLDDLVGAISEALLVTTATPSELGLGPNTHTGIVIAGTLPV